jgi:hypothetical protein
MVFGLDVIEGKCVRGWMPLLSVEEWFLNCKVNMLYFNELIQ